MKSFLVLLTIIAYSAAEVCKQDADFVILIDMSMSTSAKQFRQEKDFIYGALEDIQPLGKANNQLGVIFYSDKRYITVGAKLDSTYDNKVFKARIDPVKKQGYMTYTGAAMEKAHELFEEKNGGRPTAKKVIIIVTDGAASDGSTTKKMRDQCQKEGIMIVGVGVGAGGANALRRSVYDPSLVFAVDNYDDLDKIIHKVTSRVCTTTPKPTTTIATTAKPAPAEDAGKCKPKRGTDLFLIVDSSWSVTGADAWKKLKLQLMQVVTSLNTVGIRVDGSEDGLRVGVIEFAGDSAEIEMPLSQYGSDALLLNGLSQLKKMEGKGQNMSPVTKALQLAQNSFNRKDAKKMIVAFTDGRARSRRQVQDVMKGITKDYIASVGVSPQEWVMTGLKYIGNTGAYKSSDYTKALSQISLLARKPCFDDKTFASSSSRSRSRGRGRGRY